MADTTTRMRFVKLEPGKHRTKFGEVITDVHVVFEDAVPLHTKYPKRFRMVNPDGSTFGATDQIHPIAERAVNATEHLIAVPVGHDGWNVVRTDSGKTVNVTPLTAENASGMTGGRWCEKEVDVTSLRDSDVRSFDEVNDDADVDQIMDEYESDADESDADESVVAVHHGRGKWHLYDTSTGARVTEDDGIKKAEAMERSGGHVEKSASVVDGEYQSI